MFGIANNRLLIGLAALFSVSAQANNFNYNALEIRMGSSPSTFGGEFTTYFTENTHFIGRFDSGFSGDWDAAGGIGFNGPAGQFADIYGQMLLHNIKYESGDDDFRTEINLGARAWLMEGIEVNIRVGQIMDNDKTNSIFGVGGRFHSTEQLSLGVDIRNNGTYGHQVLMSARFGF
ncbi:hypothetical protein EK599_20560 [Vibrio sp. T187]|uniref:hypothetical protein n=1 Tax=Vibrio TaxID=662 RepID=UPI0010C98132|nr:MULTISPECIES: hypothetical protein [Vibrio]MBW3698077.1 hypothetical protein [Vibrio sp. T187]